jgi:hypothetical protein
MTSQTSPSQAQGPILKLIDFVDDIVSVGPKFRQNMTILVTYCLFGGLALSCWHHFSDKDFSFLLTLSGCVQTLAFFLLLHKIRVQKSVAGISSKTLQVYVFVFIFRLSSTLVKNGYLPVDRTGDWVYQASDIASLLLVFQLLFFMHKKYATTYQSELDTMPIYKILPAFALLGCCFHGHLNHSPFFDSVWTVGMWFDTVAMLPQLWMLVAKGGEVEALTSNYVALIFVSRVMAFWFWFTGMPELAPKDGSINAVGYMIVGAHAMQALLSADFMYHYFMWQCNNTPCGSALGCAGATTRNMVLPTGTLDV